MTLAVAAFALTVSPDLPAKKPAQVRVGSYNLRRAKLDADSPDNNWQVREPRLIQSILDAGFDASKKPVHLIHLSDNNNCVELVQESMMQFNAHVCERGACYSYELA